jgi:hypothetical protein
VEQRRRQQREERRGHGVRVIAMYREERLQVGNRFAANRRQRHFEGAGGMCERVARGDQLDARIADKECVRPEARAEQGKRGSQTDKKQKE